jgi:hypothetical protein
MNHHGGALSGSLQFGGPCAYGRMHDPLEIPTGERIGENDLSEPGPIELPVGEYLASETLDDSGERRSARLNHLAREHVSVDDDRTARRQLRGHQALSGRNTAGQADPHHTQSFFRAQSLFRFGLA